MTFNTDKKPMIILAGPTAAGKTALSIALAKAVEGSVISADSMQVYRYMDIGSAKIRPEEMQGIPHYLVDVLDPAEEFNVFRFQQMAEEALEEIYAQGRIPIIVGGTGFYIQALLYRIDFADEGGDEAFRRELEEFARTKGAHALHERLKVIDPISYGQIHENNVKRTIRALEYYHKNNAPISTHNSEQRKKKSPFNFAYFVLTDDRKTLYERIDRRVDRMMEEGLLAEVEALKERGYTKDMVAMQGLGYKELLRVQGGELSLEEAIYIVKRDTRHFAKRQLTWFRRERDCIWLDRGEWGGDEEAMLAFMCKCLREKKIIP